MESSENKFIELSKNPQNDEALKIIAASTAKASGVAAIPIPVVDVVAVTYIQVSMVKDLARVYNVDATTSNAFLLFTAFSNVTSRLLSFFINRFKVMKIFSGIFGGSVVKSTISGLFTTITGDAYHQHFSNGGTMEDFSLSIYIDEVIERIVNLTSK